MAAPIDPPLRKPIRELKSANHADGMYWELVSRESDVFMLNAPLKRGTKYSDLKGSRQAVIDLHPGGLFFCEEVLPLRSSEVGGMPGDRFVVWVWSTDWVAQSSTNAGITYSGESVTHPRYERDYIIRREVYEAGPTIATGTALTALIGVTITAAGTGYTAASGTVGTATVAFVISGGAIIAGIVTKEGSGISSGAAITITGDGTGATATAVIQPASAVLVAQEKRELPQESNLSKEFVLVRRIYETLPGPSLAGLTMADGAQGELAATTRQTLATAAAAYSPAWNTLAYSDTPLDSVKKQRDVLTAVSFPILTDYDQEPDTQSLITTTFEVVEAAAVSAPTITNGVIKRFKKIDKWRSLKIVETYSLPAGDFNEQRFMAHTFPELFDYLKYSYSDACGTFYPNSASATNARDSFSAMVEAKLRTYYTTTVQAITGITILPKSLRFGKGGSFSNALVDAGAFVYSGNCTGTFNFTASSPSYTTYGSSYKNTFQIISGESVRWKGGLYKNSELSVFML